MNDGLRLTIERHNGDLHWTITERGQVHKGSSRGVSFEDAGRELDQFIRFQKLGVHFAKQRAARAAGDRNA